MKLIPFHVYLIYKSFGNKKWKYSETKPFKADNNTELYRFIDFKSRSI